MKALGLSGSQQREALLVPATISEVGVASYREVMGGNMVRVLRERLD